MFRLTPGVGIRLGRQYNKIDSFTAISVAIAFFDNVALLSESLQRVKATLDTGMTMGPERPGTKP